MALLAALLVQGGFWRAQAQTPADASGLVSLSAVGVSLRKGGPGGNVAREQIAIPLKSSLVLSTVQGNRVRMASTIASRPDSLCRGRNQDPSSRIGPASPLSIHRTRG